MKRFICIHCHFYQPPRENPWLEALEAQDSASPFHDWNERITAECYRPNGASRILDGQRRIIKIVNNYARISFNFGPTLLSWLEERVPQVYEQILKADAESRSLFSGHGSAIAQAYNHTILPLANSRDKHTQILWGIRDFQHRFRRDPEGMWLPETAVDVETLEALSSLGINFTVLAPHQAGRLRLTPEAPWINLYGQGLDCKRAYACNLPSGRSINLFFYDGGVSRAVAFEKLLYDGENFARRLLGRFDPHGEPEQLVHIATDGETYGHHHVHGDMALAYALDSIERGGQARLTNYGEYLELHPPNQEVEIAARTSWSCMHGVARWESNCGCNSGGHGGWNQEWRKPLREALDWLRDDLADVYESEAKELLRDPWIARDEYVRVVIDRSPAVVNEFLAAHASRELSAQEELQALRLLEMQRHLMLMYTSCGWFFDEPSGPETVQVLQYAARAVQLSDQFGGERENEFLKRLEVVRSNIAEFGNGRGIYERFVRPAMLDLWGVAAHYAISSLFDGYHQRDSVYCYRAQLQDVQTYEDGRARLAIGRASITSKITHARLRFVFAVLYFGDHTLRAGIRPCHREDEFQALQEQGSAAFLNSDLALCLQVMDEYFGNATYSLKSLFHDERQRIIGQIVNSALADMDELYRQVYEQHASLTSFLSELQVPIPAILKTSAEFVLGNALRRSLTNGNLDLAYIKALLDSAQQAGISLAGCQLESAIQARLNLAVERWKKKPLDAERIDELLGVISLSRMQPFRVDLWNCQNECYEVLLEIMPNHQMPDLCIRLRKVAEHVGVISDFQKTVCEDAAASGARTSATVDVSPAVGGCEIGLRHFVAMFTAGTAR
jgi:alpha-amylase/alpha-mannosidase (GH57 family)